MLLWSCSQQPLVILDDVTKQEKHTWVPSNDVLIFQSCLERVDGTLFSRKKREKKWFLFLVASFDPNAFHFGIYLFDFVDYFCSLFLSIVCDLD